MQDKIQTYAGESIITKGNHDGMPRRDSSYLSTDERGHIQASSLGGSNTKDNVVAQAKDVNHGGYLEMERGERNALNSNAIYSEKIAFASNQPGNRPDVFMVNDKITNPEGQSHNVHLSFTNMTYAEQDSMNDLSITHASEMFDINPNPGDSLREMMSCEEYSCLMEETDETLPSVEDMYSEGWTTIDYSDYNEVEYDCGELESDYDVEADVDEM